MKIILIMHELLYILLIVKQKLSATFWTINFYKFNYFVHVIATLEYNTKPYSLMTGFYPSTRQCLHYAYTYPSTHFFNIYTYLSSMDVYYNELILFALSII